MYSYNTLYYISKKMSVIFYNRKIFKKNIDKKKNLRYNERRKKFLVRVEV